MLVGRGVGATQVNNRQTVKTKAAGPDLRRGEELRRDVQIQACEEYKN